MVSRYKQKLTAFHKKVKRDVDVDNLILMDIVVYFEKRFFRISFHYSIHTTQIYVIIGFELKYLNGPFCSCILQDVQLQLFNFSIITLKEDDFRWNHG